MKTHLAKLKAELKVLANTLKIVKFNTRQDQSSFDKKYPLKHDWEQYKILSKNQEFINTRKECWNNASNLYKAYYEYRSKHIAYCMLRGRTLEQIEPKLRDPNSYIHVQIRTEAAKIVAATLEAVNGKQP